MIKKPFALKKGDTIRVVASSSPFEEAEFIKGVAVLKDWGFKVKFGKGIFAKKYYLAGTDHRRAQELIAAINDPEAKAIMFARGGYGAIRLLPLLDAVTIKAPPKIMLGYSDVTCLLNYMHQRYQWGTFYGPVVAKGIYKGAPDLTLNSLHATLTSTAVPAPLSFSELTTIKHGEVKAPMVGGCLSLIASLLGTKYELDTHGKILFLEDVNEKPYQVDRMLYHLKLAGKLHVCKGLVFASIIGPNPHAHYIETIKDIMQDYDIPIVYGLPAGHTNLQLTLPLGIKMHLNTRTKSLHFMESALK